MNIILQTNKSEEKRVDKELVNLSERVAHLKNETDIVHPVLVLKATYDEISNCNYVTIPDFHRSYFVTDRKSITADHWELTLQSDGISSFKDEIRQHTAIIGRQENLYNLYLNDTHFKTYQNPQIITKAFPTGFTTQNYVLAVAGD